MNEWVKTILRGQSDALEHFSGDGWEMAVYTRPYGRDRICEVTDTVFAQDARIPYHTQERGYETAVLLAGRAQVTLYGRSCTLEPGDLVQIEPFMPHGFHFLEAGSVLRRIFHGADAAYVFRQRQGILSRCQDEEARTALLEELRQGEGIQILPEPAAELVEKADLPEVSPAGTGHDVFPLSGATCRMRAGRWQLGGSAEVWEYDLIPQKTLSSVAYPSHPALFMVCKGSVEVEADGEQMTAQTGDLLQFPPYQAYRLTAGCSGASLLDCYCSATLLRYLEEWEAARATAGGNEQQAALARQNFDPLHGLA